MPPRRTTEDVAVPEALGGTVKAGPPKGRGKPEAQIRRAQAATVEPDVRLPEEERAKEDRDSVLRVPIAGREFRIADNIGIMPLMEWAASVEQADPEDPSQLLATFRLLQDLVHPDDWLEFRAHTRLKKCNFDEFFAFQNAAMEALTARPTGEPATS